MGTRTPLNLSEVEQAELERVARRPSTSQALAKRCRVILLDDREDLTYAEIGEELGMREQTVLKWRSRFLEHRMAGLRDAPRPGVNEITQEMIAEVVRKTLHEKPKDATHWSLRSMERASGVSRSSVNTIWRAFNLQPHRSETFKLSTDPNFVEKTRDIVGLYMSPPENAVVICPPREAMRSARCRPWTARSRCCRCGPARPSGAPTTTTGTARAACSLGSWSRPAW
jgi:transposase